jgi:hypothetical protein
MQASRQAGRQAERHADRQTNSHTCNQTGEPTRGKADRRKGKVSKGRRLVEDRQLDRIQEINGETGKVGQRDRHDCRRQGGMHIAQRHSSKHIRQDGKTGIYAGN